MSATFAIDWDSITLPPLSQGVSFRQGYHFFDIHKGLSKCLLEFIPADKKGAYLPRTVKEHVPISDIRAFLDVADQVQAQYDAWKAQQPIGTEDFPELPVGWKWGTTKTQIQAIFSQDPLRQVKYCVVDGCLTTLGPAPFEVVTAVVEAVRIYEERSGCS